ncbi:MAG: hypothetical protein Q8M08_08465 [Bacteroidales bacterium]|nr:hypothetical protein [Bacteroidales bacterium]
MRKHIYITLMVFLMLSIGSLSGQNSVSDLYLNAGTNDFATIQKNMEQYFDGKDQGQGSGFKQWKRWEYMAERRLTPDGRVANWAVRNWEEYQNYQETHPDTDSGEPTDVPNGHWTNLGPYGYVWGNGWNGGVGRLNCIAFHPSNTSILWVGAPAGGLWKTLNGGTTWTPLTDGMPSIGVSGIAVDYTNTNIIYILSGDGDGGDTYSIGVLKSTDGGTTWLSTGLTYAVTSSVRGYKLLMHPTNHLILFVVATNGIYKTTNGGTSWTQVKTGSSQDIEFKPGDPTIVYASSGTQFWRSTDTGDTWTQIISGVPGTASRMAIGVTPASTGYVFLLTGPDTGFGSYTGTYLSTNSGVSFLTRSTTPNILGYSSVGSDDDSQSTYDLAIAVSRTASQNIMSGGINTWTSANWGTSWTITSMWDNSGGIGYTHADIHGLEVNPLNDWVYCVSDGGVFRSTNFGSTWTDLTAGIAHTQFYRIAGYESNVNLITGGTQDNGSNKWTGGTTMLHMLGADGMDCMIDHTNSNILYNMIQNGSLQKSTNGGTSFSSIKPSGSTGSWVTPIIMNPSTSTTIYGGYSDVYKSTNGGSTWTNMGVDGRGAMAMGTNNTNRIYASNGSTLYMSNDAGATWATISAGLPALTITFITVNPDNSPEVWVTLAGYTAGQKVYRSANAGTSWTNMSGSLPNVPTNCIAFEDNNSSPADAVYIGNDLGVFYRDANHTDWIPFRNGLPTVPVFDLEINKTSGVLTAGTYGRGLWRSNLYSTCAFGWILTAGNDPSNPNYTGYQFYEASSFVQSSRTITGGLGTDVMYKADNYVQLTTGFHAKKSSLFQAKLGPCNLGAPAPNSIIKVNGTYLKNNQ